MAHRFASLCSASLLFLGATFVWIAPSAAGGKAPCEFDSSSGALVVGPLDHDNVLVRPRGREILVDRRSCGATVRNTDSIRIVGGNAAAFLFHKGFLEPGKTPEPDGSPEIEVDLGAFRGTFWMRTPTGDDTIAAGSRGIDVNGDGDVDLVGGAIRGMRFVTRGGSDEVSTVGGHGTGEPVASIPVRVDAGPGRDRVTFGVGQDAALFGGRGDDRVVSSDAEFGFLVGGAGDDVLIGGSGAESIYPGFGADVVRAMGGDDVVSQPEKGDESDVFSGGAGVDELVYGGEQVFGRYAVSFDGIANDGEQGEDDDVASDFEIVRGSRGPDTLAGDGRDTTFFGGAGNDDISGGSGRDRLFGGPGDDVFHATDGRVDRIWGGKHEDTAIDRDGVDRVRDVEILERL
jgi:Ca2+-binding RTX toxin-like protein